MMRDLASFVVFLTMVVGTAVSRPLWSTIINNDIYSTPEVNSQYLAAYQDAHSPYYVYNCGLEAVINRTEATKVVSSILLTKLFRSETFNGVKNFTFGIISGIHLKTLYNIYTNTGAVPNAVHVSGKPEVSYVPAYSFYYGTPVYDLRIPLNPIYPVLTPSHPGAFPHPTLPPTSTEQPSNDDDYDGIEKLDIKVDPATETKKPGNNEENDDSITVEAI